MKIIEMEITKKEIEAANADVTEVTNKIEQLAIVFGHKYNSDFAEMFIIAIKKSIDEENEFDSDIAQEFFSEYLREL